MISNQILQNTIEGLKGITRIDLCIIDTEGKVLLRQTARSCKDISFLKYLTRTSWNIFC